MPEAGHAVRFPVVDTEPVSLYEAEADPAPIVFDAPHSGRHYPKDFRPAVDHHILAGGEDRFVDDVVADAPRHGAALVVANFARTYIDLNRELTDLDTGMLDGEWPHPVAPGINSERGVGLVFRDIGDAVPIYDRKLTVAEVQGRIDNFWQPYHEILDAALDARQDRFGQAWHVNCHSMSGVGNVLSPDPGVIRPHFVLGDLHGTTCAPEFTRLVADTLEAMGYSVGVNVPYAGAELVRRHGRPAQGRHSLQIEINRTLYMDMDTLEATAGFLTLRENMSRLASIVCDYARRQVAEGGGGALARAPRSS